MTSALFLGNMLSARKSGKYRFALCFRVVSNQYVERSAYANVLKFNRENERFERGKLNSTCFHWFPAAIAHFADMAAILNSIVLNIYYGMLWGQINIYLPPEHPIIDV